MNAETLAVTLPMDPLRVAVTCAPAKLNLFLELLARRSDGYHEIDTVMVPIDWCDQLQVQRTADPGVRLQVNWIPSRQVLANRLGVESNSERGDALLAIPADDRNLVHRALARFSQRLQLSGGFQCQLDKSIPAGAGMGGASSDAAAALRCAAALCGIAADAEILVEIAAELGSDIPFFLGLGGLSLVAARARGRGEQLHSIELSKPLHCVVVFPAVSLSTAKVYAASDVPQTPQKADPLLAALARGSHAELAKTIFNRLAAPAGKLAPQIDEILESLWRAGLKTCQLTGSGSACFAVASSVRQAQRCALQVRAQLEPGAIVMATSTTRVPPPVDIR